MCHFTFFVPIFVFQSLRCLVLALKGKSPHEHLNIAPSVRSQCQQTTHILAGCYARMKDTSEKKAALVILFLKECKQRMQTSWAACLREYLFMRSPHPSSNAGLSQILSFDLKLTRSAPTALSDYFHKAEKTIYHWEKRRHSPSPGLSHKVPQTDYFRSDSNFKTQEGLLELCKGFWAPLCLR